MQTIPQKKNTFSLLPNHLPSRFHWRRGKEVPLFHLLSYSYGLCPPKGPPEHLYPHHQNHHSPWNPTAIHTYHQSMSCSHTTMEASGLLLIGVTFPGTRQKGQAVVALSACVAAIAFSSSSLSSCFPLFSYSTPSTSPKFRPIKSTASASRLSPSSLT